jgi:hypothetical protein
MEEARDSAAMLACLLLYALGIFAIVAGLLAWWLL